MLKEKLLFVIDWLIEPRSISTVLIAIVTLLGLNYTIFSLIAPFKTVNDINNSIVITDKHKRMPALSNSEIKMLYREQAFYESRLELAKSDSLILAINFPDSMISVEIKGIPIHSIPLRRFEIPRFFSLLNNNVYHEIYSRPHRIISSHATSKKEPIMVVNAPKDTNEYNASGIKENYDTNVIRLTFVEYEITTGTRLVFIPLDERNFHNQLIDFGFNIRLAFCRFKDAFRASLQLSIPEYKPVVKVYLPQGDILSMHRAIPEHAELCVQF